ncbi:MAG: hypothetical protein U5J82_14365 [Desulfobacterales bacterium]|nr:hypothetical protein [Desulfobacterales bacterium]
MAKLNNNSYRVLWRKLQGGVGVRLSKHTFSAGKLDVEILAEVKFSGHCAEKCSELTPSLPAAPKFLRTQTLNSDDFNFSFCRRQTAFLVEARIFINFHKQSLAYSRWN